MTTTLRYQVRSWDSSFFKRKIGDIDWTSAGSGDATNFELITTKIASDDSEKIYLLNQADFHYCEGEISFTKNLNKQVSSEFETADDSDIPALMKLAQNLYQHTRFKAPWFNKNEANTFYCEWLQKAVKGEFDDLCIVQRLHNDIVGFITIRICNHVAQVGLLGVNPAYQGQGIGHKLIQNCESYLAPTEAKILKVSTQLSNVAASNLYISNHFQVENTAMWFYKNLRLSKQKPFNHVKT